MKSIEVEAKTVEEAIIKGTAELGLTLGEVDIDILEEGSKGFLSIGAKQARVRLTEKAAAGGDVVAFIEELLKKMGINATAEAEQSGDDLIIRLSGERMGTVIGRRGETLDAIQYLASLQVNKGKGEYRRVIVDAENYRATREKALIRLANNMAKRAAETGRKVSLEHMSAFERRVIHSALQDNPDVTTVSEGEGRMRHVVIVPQK